MKQTGLQEALKHLTSEPDKVQVELLDTMSKTVNAVVADAKKNVPVISGSLQKSIHSSKTKDGFTVTVDAPYGLAVHENPNSSGYKFLELAMKKNLK